MPKIKELSDFDKDFDILKYYCFIEKVIPLKNLFVNILSQLKPLNLSHGSQVISLCLLFF